MSKKKKYKELDVDYIGDQKPLSKVEEEELTEYFKKKKEEKRLKKLGQSTEESKPEHPPVIE